MIFREIENGSNKDGKEEKELTIIRRERKHVTVIFFSKKLIQSQLSSTIQHRFPCKPDCDQRIFPHCTEECKCDYLYPIVQRFCNPPPLPFFLNTCR
uniref:Uncharacterized protein n=1 Tax=Angiostrongylus cantonensis TaxID=6313 RepID=A0A0K0D8E4_ANGCA